VEQGKLILAWHSPPHLQPGDAELDLAAEMLADGKQSRLHRALVRDTRLALRVEAYQLSRQLVSLFVVAVTARRGVDLKRVERVTRRVVADMIAAPPAGEELRRMRRGFETEFVTHLQSLRRRADLLNLYAYTAGSPDGVSADLQRYRAVTPETVHAACRRVLSWPGSALWVLPRDRADRADRAGAPP
jgi:predicted Zn-dependent peptidase